MNVANYECVVVRQLEIVCDLIMPLTPFQILLRSWELHQLCWYENYHILSKCTDFRRFKAGLLYHNDRRYRYVWNELYN